MAADSFSISFPDFRAPSPPDRVPRVVESRYIERERRIEDASRREANKYRRVLSAGFWWVRAGCAATGTCVSSQRSRGPDDTVFIGNEDRPAGRPLRVNRATPLPSPLHYSCHPISPRIETFSVIWLNSKGTEMGGETEGGRERERENSCSR